MIFVQFIHTFNFSLQLQHGQKVDPQIHIGQLIDESARAFEEGRIEMNLSLNDQSMIRLIKFVFF